MEIFKNQKFIFLALFGLVFFIFINAFISQKQGKQADIKQFVVQKRDIIEAVYGRGKLYSSEERIIHSEVSGEIAEVLCSEGDEAQAGEVLIAVRNPNIAQEVKIAEAKMLEAKEKLNKLRQGPAKTEILQAQSLRDKAYAGYRRLKKALKDEEELFTKGFSSQKKFEEVKAAYQIAENDWKLAEENFNRAEAKPKKHEISLAEANFLQAESNYKQLQEKQTKLKVTAPFTGTVIELTIAKDDLSQGVNKIQEGIKLLTLANMSKMLIKGMIFESDINKVSLNQEVLIPIKEKAKTIQGKLVFVSQKAQSMGNLNKFEVRIELDKYYAFLKYGMNIEFRIVITKREGVLAVPLEYIFREENSYFVYILKGRKLAKKVISKGVDDNLYGEVKEGLKEGDLVALRLNKY